MDNEQLSPTPPVPTQEEMEQAAKEWAAALPDK